MKAPFIGFVNRLYPQGSCSQWFGENPALYAHMGMRGHNGIDYVAEFGKPLYAVKKGYICDVTTNNNTGYGFEVRLRTEDNEVWIYAHMSKVSVKLNQKVEEGEYLGNMGNTGFVVTSIDGNGFWVKGSNKHAGTHLHTAKRIVHNYVEGVDKNWHGYHNGIPYVVENLDNGFNGWLDCRKDFDNVDPPTIQEIQKDLELQGYTSLWDKISAVLKSFGIS